MGAGGRLRAVCRMRHRTRWGVDRQPAREARNPFGRPISRTSSTPTLPTQQLAQWNSWTTTAETGEAQTYRSRREHGGMKSEPPAEPEKVICEPCECRYGRVLSGISFAPTCSSGHKRGWQKLGSSRSILPRRMLQRAVGPALRTPVFGSMAWSSSNLPTMRLPIAIVPWLGAPLGPRQECGTRRTGPGVAQLCGTPKTRNARRPTRRTRSAAGLSCRVDHVHERLGRPLFLELIVNRRGAVIKAGLAA